MFTITVQIYQKLLKNHQMVPFMMFCEKNNS